MADAVCAPARSRSEGDEDEIEPGLTESLSLPGLAASPLTPDRKTGTMHQARGGGLMEAEMQSSNELCQRAIAGTDVFYVFFLRI